MENKMTQNLIMIDHASKDVRSVKAMLQGNGDGRENVWLDFEKSLYFLPQEVIMERFRIESRYELKYAENIHAISPIWRSFRH